MQDVMFTRLDTMEKSYFNLQEKMQDVNITSDDLIKLQKEFSELSDVVLMYQDYKKIKEELLECQKIISKEKDQELIELAKEEEKDLLRKKEELEINLRYELLPKDPNDKKNIIVEIKGAVGGDEANIFAGDLFRMYQKYSEKNNFKIEILDQSQSASGGFSKIEFIIKGKGAYSKFKYESGVHRVQRVPETESQGRVHTSTATVYIMPEAEDIDIKIDPSDLKIDTYHSSGAGGQSVNTTMSAVRITHIPTGIVVACQNERSQIQNKEKALISLRARLYQKYEDENKEKADSSKKSAVGQGMRSEKIRTYNYPQNRVSDHRFNITVKRLTDIIDGNLDLILIPLNDAIKNEELKGK